VNASLRRARICALTAAALTAVGIWTATVTTPWLAIPGLYTAAVIAWCAGREYAIHRNALNGLCCSFWRHSDGRAHSPNCPTHTTKGSTR
jgi:hypothetical protein